jgi:hypothetical protein
VQKIFINGLEKNRILQYPGAKLVQDDYFKIGLNDNFPGVLFDGLVDELAIFDRALTDEEIRAVYLQTASIGFRVRSGVASSLSGDYVGPDGTTNSYYVKPYELLTAVGAFDPANQFLQYKASFMSDSASTPYLDAVRLEGVLSNSWDDTFGHFSRGTSFVATTNIPSAKDTPYVRLAKSVNGGYPTNGTFTSRVFDPGSSVTWNQILWNAGGVELQTNSLTNLEGLWHFNGTWSDVSGKGHDGTPSGGAGFSSFAKLGTNSATFNGTGAIVNIGSMGTTLKTVEWWMKTPRTDCGIMELASAQAWLAVSNKMVWVGGNSATGLTIYVNGGTQPTLLPGWNHVAVTFEAGVSNTAVVLGQANGSYFEGDLDEVAMFSRVLAQSEVKEHVALGRRTAAGQILFQARADTNNPPQTPFVGWNDATTTYFVNQAGTALPSSFYTKPYFQYRAFMTGDGSASLALNSVTAIYSGSSTITDNTRDTFNLGTHGGTEWTGDTVARDAVQTIGPEVLSLSNSTSVVTLWHMDDVAWTNATASVTDATGNGRDGTPAGTVYLSGAAKVGSGAGLFQTNGVITAQGGFFGTGDFTVSLWWSSTMTGRCALATAYSDTLSSYYALELNPAGAATGSVAFVLSDGSTVYRATSFRAGLADGAWHHISGIKQGGRIYLYVDGVMDSSLPVTSFSLGAVTVSLGKYGSSPIYFAGMLDEVVTHSRALAEWEIADLAAAGYATRGKGTFLGPVLDGTQPTSWDRLRWVADAPYGKEHAADVGAIVGLWHCNAISNGVTSDASGYGNDGTVEGGGSFSASGRLGSCLSLGVGQDVRVYWASGSVLDAPIFSWETWVWLTTEADVSLINKSSGVNGIKLGVDAAGLPYFQAGTAVAAARKALRIQQWNHVAGTYDGAMVCLYVNGRLKARVAAAGNPVASVDAVIGGGGLFDEVAMYNRALTPEEALDHYRAGAVTLGLQARSGASAVLTGDFVGPNGTTNTYYTDPANTVLSSSVIPVKQYFQYQATLATEDPALTPLLQGVEVEMSSYPTNKPWVTPADGYGSAFLGNLVSFMHVLGTNNNDTEVNYQISGNNGTNWYAWVSGVWQDVTLIPTWMNTRTEIADNITSFYEAHYATTGGVFKFKAFLKSAATNQVALDDVQLGYASGRIVVTVPNGLEIGDAAWLQGTTNVVQWVATGAVGDKVKLEYSLNSGSTWSLIASNVANGAGANSYPTWVTPYDSLNPSLDACRVRVTDMADTYISDLSDTNFSLKTTFKMVVPNGGERWYTGRSNRVLWAAARTLGRVNLDYAADGITYNYRLSENEFSAQSTLSNEYWWVTPMKVPEILSEGGKMRVQSYPTGSKFDVSDATFTLAGIEFTNPRLGSSVKRNAPFNIQWMAAGAGALVDIDFSTDSGASWTTVVSSNSCSVGSNSVSWVASAPPTDTARLQIRSLSDTNVVGVSEIFALADIDLTSPVAGTNWLMGTTNQITWQAGGASNSVNIYYSTNSGVEGSWVRVAMGATNVSGANSYDWLVPMYPGPKTRVKVEAVSDTNNLWSVSSDFNIAGIRVTVPTNGATWVKGVQSPLSWEYQSVGSLCTIQYSFDGGLNYTNISSSGIGLSEGGYVYTPTWPTVRGKIKVVADDPSPFANVFDESEGYFTVAGITVTAPTGNVSFTIGTLNTVGWTSAGAVDPDNNATLYYIVGAVTNQIDTVGNNQSYSGGNTYQWTVLPGTTPSATARIMVKSGAYSGTSAPFTLRGIKFTAPEVGTVFDIGSTTNMAWIYAGLDPASAAGYFYLSTDGGSTYHSTPINPTPLWPVDGLMYPWKISADTTPTTNAVLKFRVTSSDRPEDIGYEAISKPFAIRGMKVLAPSSTSVWQQGQTNVITWLSLWAGSVATLSYSPNGSTYDARSITSNWAMVDGTNTFSWPAESFRTPSTNAKIRVASASATAISEAFTMRGIRVTVPVGSDIWALDETNRLAWTAVGANGQYDLWLVRDGSEVIPLTNGITTPYYDWIVTSNAISTNVVLVVQDSSGMKGMSDMFRIVGEPTISMISPLAGDLVKVSQSYTITWSKGGKMDNNFLIQYSTSPYSTTTDIYNGETDLNTTDNTYSIPWSVQDRLGSTIIIVQNNAIPSVKTVSEPFSVVGMFTVDTPNGGETNIYARKRTTLSWLTRGSVRQVNLYYSTDSSHQTWIPFTGNPVTNYGGGEADQSTTYDWTAADVDSQTVRFRVQQANQPGAYDDSDHDFAINYYAISWNVHDSVTSNNLDKLTVVDSSPWSQADLTSPVVHRYPYGSFNTVWGREYFFNNVTFDWNAEPSREIDVWLTRSSTEPDFAVLANFVYDVSNAQYRVTSWLQQKGKMVINPAACTISVYDVTGSKVFQTTSTTPDANGVFWQALSTNLTKGVVYYAKVEIEFSGVTYSSGVTFNLLVPADAGQAQLMLNALTNIQSIASRVDTNLIGLADAQRIFRASAEAKLDSLTNSAEVIKAGLTNLEVKVDMLSTQALSRLNDLTNAVGVIGSGGTNLIDQVRALTADVATRRSAILTRPTSLKLGGSLALLYRTLPGLPPATYEVYIAGPGGTSVEGPFSMGAGTGGIYERMLTASWGVGDYKIVCSDNSGASDQMIIKVTAIELDDLAGTFVNVSNQLANVELSLATMSASVSNVQKTVDGTATNVVGLLTNVVSLETMMAGLTNMPGQMSYLTNVIEKVAGLTNMNTAVSSLTNAVGSILVLTNMSTQISQLGALTNLSVQMAALTNSMARLSLVTNSVNDLSAQLAYVTNVIDRIVVLTNINSSVAAMTGAVAQITVLTNMGSQLNYLTNAMGQVQGLTNLSPQMASVTNLLGRMASLTNLTPQVAALTNMPAQLAGLTNLPAEIAGVTTAIGQLGSLTNLGPQVDQLVAAIGQITSLTNLSSRMDSVVTAVGQLGSLTNLGPQVDQLVAAIGQISSLTNLSSRMDSVVTAVGQLGSLTNLGSEVTSLNAAMGSIMGLTNMAGQVNGLTTTLNGMTNLNTKMDALNGAIGQIASVTNMIGTLNGMVAAVNQLGSLTNLETEVAQLNAGVGQLGSLTNMQPQVASILAGMGALGSLTNLGPQVDTLNGAIGEIMALTNLASQVNGVATGVTGLESTVGTMSNTLASLNAAFLAFQTVSNSLSGVSALAPEMASISTTVSNLQSSMIPMSASIAGVSSNIQTSLSPMQASLAALTGGLGAASDAAGKETLFGYIFELEKNLGAVGVSAQQAMSRAGGARSQANSAAGAAMRIKNAVATGQIPKVMGDLEIIRKSLEETLLQVRGIPGQMSTAEMVKTVNDAAMTMKTMAAGRGVAMPLGADSTGSPQAGSLTDPKAVGELLNKLAETKAMMEATRLLMDEAINKPVVVDWLEGTK